MSYDQNDYLSQLTKQIDAQQEKAGKEKPTFNLRPRGVSIKSPNIIPKSPVTFEQVTRTVVVDPNKKPSKKEKKQKPEKKKEGGFTKEQRQAQYENQAKQKQEKKKSSSSGKHPSSPLKKTERFFTHIDDFKPEKNKKKLSINNDTVHPVIIKFAYKYADDRSYIGNSMAVEFLTAFKQVIMEFDAKDSGDDEKVTYFQAYKNLYESVNAMIGFIVEQRPLTTSLGNTITFFKNLLSQTDKNLSLVEAKEEICYAMDNFKRERIELSVREIVNHGVGVIKDGDSIMVFSCSEAVEQILISATNKGKKFKVIVVDSRPNHEGRKTLSNLSTAGIKCSFVSISAASYMMKETTKVLVGAASMLSNGFAVGRIGTASLALIANNFNIPFIICCETYKFSEKIYLDSSTNNELGNEDDILSIGKEEEILKGNEKNIHILNLIYDVTPKEFIHVVITERV
eukprot:gene6582-10745_t